MYRCVSVDQQHHLLVEGRMKKKRELKDGTAQNNTIHVIKPILLN